jgi:cytoskeletal protein CcmA (bactofilin family)
MKEYKVSNTNLPFIDTARLVSGERLGAISSLIGEGAHFEGDFKTAKDLGIRVDGRLKGAVGFDKGGAVHVGPTGVIEGTVIEADHVFIEGRVVGTVIARKTLEISGSATLVGDALYDALIDIHPRARIKGKIDYRGDMDSPVAG